MILVATRAHWIAHRLSRGGGLKYPYPAAGHGTRCPILSRRHALCAAPECISMSSVLSRTLPLSIGAGPTG